MLKTIELDEMNLENIISNLRNSDVEEVRVKIDDEEDTHIEFRFRYDKNRKKYYLSSNPVKIDGNMISYKLFSGSFMYLNESPIARKSPKQERIARETIDVRLLKTVLEDIENNKR